MKKHFFFCLALLMGATAYAQSGEKTIQVTVSNDWKESKTDEPVVIDLRTLDLGFTVKSATVWDGSTEIPSQLDDMNGDARADELALLVNMPAKSSKDLRIVLSSAKSDKQYPATYCCCSIHYRLISSSMVQLPFLSKNTWKQARTTVYF